METHANVRNKLFRAETAHVKTCKHILNEVAYEDIYGSNAGSRRSPST